MYRRAVKFTGHNVHAPKLEVISNFHITLTNITATKSNTSSFGIANHTGGSPLPVIYEIIKCTCCLHSIQTLWAVYYVPYNIGVGNLKNCNSIWN